MTILMLCIGANSLMNKVSWSDGGKKMTYHRLACRIRCPTYLPACRRAPTPTCRATRLPIYYHAPSYSPPPRADDSTLLLYRYYHLPILPYFTRACLRCRYALPVRAAHARCSSRAFSICRTRTRARFWIHPPPGRSGPLVWFIVGPVVFDCRW